MIAFWALAVSASCIVAALLIRPLLGNVAPVVGKAGSELQDRLAAIERDADAGLISPADAVEARIEAQRSALSAPTGRDGVQVARKTRLAAIAFAGAMPLLAVAAYLAIGSPELIGARPPAQSDIASLAPAEQRQAIESMVAGLGERLKANPEDVEGWRMLARSYSVIGETERSAGAYLELFSRADGTIEDWRGYAGVLLALGPGEGREAQLDRAVARLSAADPDDPMALYFLGEKAKATGDIATAVARWKRLLEILPADAPVRPAVEALIREAEAE